MTRAIYAWVTQSASDRWTFVGTITAAGHTPMVSHDRQTIEALRPLAIAHGAALDQRVAMVSWHDMQTIETIEPTETANDEHFDRER